MKFVARIAGRLAPLCAIAAMVIVTPAAAQERQPKLDPQGQYEELERLNREGRESKANQESGEDVRGREEWFYFQRRYPYDMIPAGIRAAAIREMKTEQGRLSLARSKKADVVTLAANRWENIGPANFSGRIRAIGVHPTATGVIWVGAAAGGVWRTLTGGNNWTTTFDTLSSLAMGALAVDPSNPDIIYAGTGENSANIDAYLGDGIFKSTDGGTTWKNIGLTTVQGFSKIYVNRQNHNIVYVAAAASSSRGSSGGGFYRSEDGGQTWTRTVTSDVWDIAVDPNDCNNIFIALSGSVRRSTDAGKTFTTTTTGMNLSSSVRISIGLSGAEPTRVYALVARNGGPGGNHIGEVYVTNNSGGQWTLKKTMPSGFFNQQGWYDNCIAVGPDNPDLVLVGGIDVYRTQDGGDSWQNTTLSYAGGNTHPDQHVLEFDPLGSIVYLGNDGGVYASFDQGGSWQKISTALPTSQYYAIEVDQTKPYRVYGGTQDNGTHGSYGTNGFTPNWNSVLGGDGFFVVVDLSDPNIIYAENFNGTPLYKMDATTLGSRSRIDGSISPDANRGDYGNWVTPIAMSPADKKTLYTGRSALYRTSNRGSNWQKLTPGNSAKISAIGLSPFDSKKIIIGTATGEVKYTTDDGATWAAAKITGGSASRFVTDVVFDPVDPNRVYLTFSGSSGFRVYRSDDNGATFNSISSNLPNTPANAIAIDPQNNSHIFVGTDIGVFASVDGGGYWGAMNDGMAIVPVADLKIHESSRYLIAGTHGRSMFRTNISSVTVAPGLLYPIGNEVIATPGPLVIRWAGFDGPVNVFISYDGGVNWQQVGTDVTGSSDSLNLPLVQSTNARVRVVESGGSGLSVESGDFTLKATTNGIEQPGRGFIAEAIEVRKGYLWSTVKGNDSLYVMRLPLLSARTGLVRTNIPGHVRDMAYDSVADRFYMLVTADDFSAPKIYKMDSAGAGQGEVPVPAALTKVNGIAAVGSNLALVTPGAQAEIVVIDTNGVEVSRPGVLQGNTDQDRRGLVWDGQGYVQGVVESDQSVIFPSKLQILSPGSPLRIRESQPIVLQTMRRLGFVGLAYDPSNADINQRTYWATDTNGQFFRFTRQAFFSSGVDAGPAVVTGPSRTRSVTIGEIAPNPTRGEASVHLTVRGARAVSVELYDAAGSRQLEVFNGRLEAGEHAIEMHGASLPSGIYYLVVTGGGDRDVRPVVMIR